MEYTFSSGGTCSPSSTRRRVWLMTFSPRSQYAVICWRSWSIATPPSTSTPLILAVFLTTWRAGLVNDLLAQVAVRRDLLAELVDRHAAEHVDTLDLGGLLDDLARAFQHLPGDAE